MGFFNPLAISLLFLCLNVFSQSNMPYDATTTTYRLTQSLPSFVMWTAPSTRRAFSTDTPPTATGSKISIDCAKQEFEPFQIVISPPATSTTFTVSMSAFTNLGSKQRVTLEKALFDDGLGVTGKRIVDFLNPVTTPATLLTTEPYVLWVTVRVPLDAIAGLSTATLTITPNGQAPINIPIELTVHNWIMPITGHFEAVYQGMPRPCMSTQACNDAYKRVYVEYKMNMEKPGMIIIIVIILFFIIFSMPRPSIIIFIFSMFEFLLLIYHY